MPNKHNLPQMFYSTPAKMNSGLSMQPTKLDSSLLAGVQYDPHRRHLDVEFHSGQRYRYFNVPTRCYQELLRAESSGRYFNRSIRNCFPYQNLSRSSAPLVLVAGKTK